MAANPDSILVIKPSSFGDVVHALPAVSFLKQTWPRAKLSWLINPEWKPLLEGNPDVDDVITFPRAEFRGCMGGARFFRWCHRRLGPQRPELVVDFQGLLRSAWMGRSSGGRFFVGMSDAREGARFFYDVAVPMPAGIPHAVERYLSTAAGAVYALGGKPVTTAGANTVYHLPEGVSPAEHSDLPVSYVLLHPYARGEGKSLTEAQVEMFCRRLSPCPVIVVGRTSKHRSLRLPASGVNLLDQTSLSQLIWLVRQAQTVVTVDSGPSHLAAALGRPLVAIHIWSDPRKVGPYRPDACVWKGGQLLTMREIVRQDAAFFRAKPVSLREKDLETVAGTVISLSNSCA